MATAFTGSLGWTGAHPIQLGGPPLVNTYARPLPSGATPLLAHVYEADGVTSKGTLQVRNRPVIKATLANGGYEQITLEVASQSTAAVYGQVTYGQPLYGGRVLQGNVIRLTETNNPVSGTAAPWPGFIYGGVVESLPDTRSPSGTKHQIVVSPFGWELTRVATQLVYFQPVDIVQAVRDAVALTQHCSCDQVSVPPTTGIPLVSTTGGAVDFRGQKVAQVLDTCRSIAGPTWFWHCDELGRVWFQSQASTAVYTLTGGQHYEERTTNGGDIQNRINQVPAVGGVPTGGSANVTATYNGASQSLIGTRTLDPPIQLPGITDQATIQAIANGIGATLDQTWTRVQIKALPTFAQRVHASQPGGGTVRYWEPVKNALPESGAGTGYVGPFIGQSVSYDGLYQDVEAGNIPVTSTTDIDNLVKTWANRAAAISLINTGASLNLQQTLTGSFQSGGGTVVNGQRATLWSLGQLEFAAIDQNAVTRAEMGNLGPNGISPAQWGIRVNDANGVPILDAIGLSQVMQQLVNLAATASPFTSSSATPVVVTGTSQNFSLSRTQRLLFAWAASCSYSGGGAQTTFADLALDGVDLSNGVSSPAMQLQFPTTSTGAVTSLGLYSASVAAGAHTADVRAFQNGTPSFTLQFTTLLIFALGS